MLPNSVICPCLLSGLLIHACCPYRPTRISVIPASSTHLELTTAVMESMYYAAVLAVQLTAVRLTCKFAGNPKHSDALQAVSISMQPTFSSHTLHVQRIALLIGLSGLHSTMLELTQSLKRLERAALSTRLSSHPGAQMPLSSSPMRLCALKTPSIRELCQIDHTISCQQLQTAQDLTDSTVQVFNLCGCNSTDPCGLLWHFLR